MQQLRAVVGRVVHVAGPHVAPATAPSAAAAGQDGAVDNPYQLPAGEQYYIVHAEMMMQHRWVFAS